MISSQLLCFVILSGSLAALINLGATNRCSSAEGLAGLLAFPFLILKEPELERERVFSREAIAFTFTEKAVLIAAFLMMGSAIGTRKISNPTGGMFSLVMKEIIGGFTPEKAGFISVVVLLSGIPASVVGGWAADKWAINAST